MSEKDEILKEEKKLYQEIKKGNANSLNKLVINNLKMLNPIANSLAHRGRQWGPEDLYQEGAIAMYRFAHRWKPMEGITFAMACRLRVTGAMKDFLRRKADLIKNSRAEIIRLDSHPPDSFDETLLDSLAIDDNGEISLASISLYNH